MQGTDQELNKRVTGKDLLKLGVQEGPQLGKLLKHAQAHQDRGMARESILEEIKKELSRQRLSPPPKLLELKSAPLKISVAVDSISAEEEENIALSLKKMEELSLCPIVDGASLMPDTCPAGSDFGSIPVGGAISTENHILPSAHSSDLCCSMMATIFKCSSTTANILNIMEESTHFGPSGRPKDKQAWDPILSKDVWSNPFLKGLESTAQSHLQTQGDGNHFFYLGNIENIQTLAKHLDKSGHYAIAKNLVDSKLENSLVMVTHHGSRNLGAQIYKRGLEVAQKETKKIAKNIPKNLSWIDLSTPLGKAYWEAIDYAQKWTIANHKLIHNATLEKLGARAIATLSNAHNFVWKEGGRILHGKGATPAWNSETGIPSLGIIPLNMASEILITLGGNNQQYLGFCPHGAGRNKSRTKTLEKYRDPNTKEINKNLIESDFKAQTKGIDVRWASKKLDISESPLGYKNKDRVKQQILKFGLATVICEMAPKGCIMAGEFERPWDIKKKKNKVEEEKFAPSI